MKIAALAFDFTRYTMISKLVDGLRLEGHDVVAFLEHDSNLIKNKFRQRLRWSQSNLKPLKDYNPDRVLIFNGRAEVLSGATSYIQHRYPTFFIEQGWLPQKGNLYIDHMGLGGSSSIANSDLALFRKAENHDEVVEFLKTTYKPQPKPDWLPEKYIAIPIQLEHDTSIRLDSPHFKTMESMVGFVKENLRGHNIVVKDHPYAKKPFSYSGITVAPGKSDDCTMNTLAYYADAVVGINSTSLIEALVHNKPVVALGRNMLSYSGVYCNNGEITNLKNCIAEAPAQDRVMNVLVQLHNLQFSRSSLPPKRILDYIRYKKYE